MKVSPPAQGPARGARRHKGWRPRPVSMALFMLALGLMALFVGLALSSDPGSALSAWDRGVTKAFVDWRAPGRSELFWVLTLIGNYSMLAALCLSAVLLLFVWGRRGRAALVAVGMLVGWGISEAAKAIVGRARPPAVEALIAPPRSGSLPSGHALTTLLFLGLLVFLVWRYWGGVAAWGRAAARGPGAGRTLTATFAAMILAGLIGVSRVYLGVHWLSDVLAGWCLGSMWLVVLLGVVRPWWLRRQRARISGGGGGSGSGNVGGTLGAFLGRRAPASAAVRVATVVFVVVLCVVAAILTGWSDPLLRDM